MLWRPSYLTLSRYVTAAQARGGVPWAGGLLVSTTPTSAAVRATPATQDGVNMLQALGLAGVAQAAPHLQRHTRGFRTAAASARW